MTLPARVFREYDLRGVADRDFPDGGVRDRGRATIHGAEIQALRRLLATREFAGGAGSHEERDVVGPYVEHAKSKLALGARRPRVVVDAGNGAGGPAAVRLYRELGLDVTPL